MSINSEEKEERTYPSDSRSKARFRELLRATPQSHRRFSHSSLQLTSRFERENVKTSFRATGVAQTGRVVAYKTMPDKPGVVPVKVKEIKMPRDSTTGYISFEKDAVSSIEKKVVCRQISSAHSHNKQRSSVE